jgi:hypothetical protein
MKSQSDMAWAASGWVTTVWWSELAVLTGYPILMTDVPLHEVDTTEPFKTRMREWWHTRRSDAPAALAKRRVAGNNRFLRMQVTLFLIGTVFRLWFIETLAEDEANVSTNVDTSTHELLANIVATPRVYSIVGILVTHPLQSIASRHHIVHEAVGDNPAIVTIKQGWYWFTHFTSPINFAFDLPGIGIPGVHYSSRRIRTSNALALTILLILIVAKEPVSQAYGCYPQWYSFYKYDHGLCPAYLCRNNAECKGSAACNVPGARCDEFSSRWSHTMGHALSISASIVSYGGAVPPIGPD